LLNRGAGLGLEFICAVDDSLHDAAAVAQRPNLVRAIVGKEVFPDELGDFLATIDVAAGHAPAAIGRPLVPVGVDWRHRIRGSRIIDAGRGLVSLDGAPSIVASAGRAGPLEVDFLDLVLADVADPKAAGETVKTASPRVAQSEGPDLGRSAAAGKRVVAGNPVGFSAGRVVDVDAQEFAQQRIEILAIAVRVVACAAIAHRDVEVFVRSEGDPPAVVIGVGLVDFQEHELAGFVGALDAGTFLVAANLGVAIFIREIDVEVSVARVVGMERQAEEPLLASGLEVADHEKGLGRHLPGRGVQNLDRPAPLRDKEPRVARRHDRGNRSIEALGHQLGARSLRTGHRQDQHHCESCEAGHFHPGTLHDSGKSATATRGIFREAKE